MKKTFAVAALIATTLTAPAFATNSLGITRDVDDNASYINLNLVRATGAGYVAIVDMDGNELGRSDVVAGANSDVRITLPGTAPVNDVMAQLWVDGMMVDTQTIDVDG
ncbi:hypothetical protein [Shimia ponticola]|uniref:hypothetical protein n=1 Tax=Shimia ponticola TaxID=2582893 RepID=UPI0011BEBCEE|nr:hypothetical protein [Shimia ponticola]